jgi:hypothetical protein
MLAQFLPRHSVTLKGSGWTFARWVPIFILRKWVSHVVSWNVPTNNCPHLSVNAEMLLGIKKGIEHLAWVLTLGVQNRLFDNHRKFSSQIVHWI